MELEITWKRAIRVWWSYLWRNLLAILAAMVAGGVIGGMLGFFLGLLGVPVETIKLVAAPIGAVLGLGLSVVPIKLILGKDYGEFRLVLLSKEAPPLLPLRVIGTEPNQAPQPTTGLEPGRG